MLTATNVHAGYGKKEILHGVNCVMENGKVNVLLGPNGCGKSTMLKCLAGLLPLSRGEIMLDRQDISHLREKERAKRISVLPQGRDVPDMTVRDLALCGRWVYGRQKCDEDMLQNTLSRVGLSALADARLSSLSGGQRQKAYLAMLLMQNTDTLLFDEPTTYLDAACQLDTWEMCAQLAAEGKTVCVVSHELPQALHYAQKCILMQDGLVPAHGTPDEIYQSGILCSVFGVRLTRYGNEYTISERLKEEN